MTALPVEWVLVTYYGPSAHRATYGRLGGTKYTKDYIQLSRKKDFMDAVTNLFPAPESGAGSVPLTYRWPTGEAPGALVFRSADRPHLKWETNLGAPLAWKMTPQPSEDTAETIPGDPSHLDMDAAERELELLQNGNAGQPYLLAVKLRGEPSSLQLRAYLAEPGDQYTWADIQQTPSEVQDLCNETSQTSALAWTTFQSGGTAPSSSVTQALSALAAAQNFQAVVDDLTPDIGRALAAYIRQPAYGLFFDPSRNHDAWLRGEMLAARVIQNRDEILGMLDVRFPAISQSDALAETLDVSAEDVAAFANQIQNQNYEVPDTYASAKVRGSAQRAFSNVVKSNYGDRCAITGIDTRDFLVAAHIVPWSVDQTVRLDPSNGICLSLLMDRAFENGFIIIEDDLTIVVNWAKVGDDAALASLLQAYDGQTVSMPSKHPPNPEYLQRRRELN